MPKEQSSRNSLLVPMPSAQRENDTCVSDLVYGGGKILWNWYVDRFTSVIVNRE